MSEPSRTLDLGQADTPMALSHPLRRGPLEKAGSGARVAQTFGEVLP